MVELRWQGVRPGARAPSRARDGDAGLDLCAAVDVTLPPGGGRATVPTGVALAVPAGHVGYVMSRSGLAAHHGVACLNAPGVIDSGYRGEIAVVLVNTDARQAYEVRTGDRIAQLVIERTEQVVLTRVEALDETERSSSGLGSTGP